MKKSLNADDHAGSSSMVKSNEAVKWNDNNGNNTTNAKNKRKNNNMDKKQDQGFKKSLNRC